MANLKYNLVRFGDEATLTVFHDGQARVASDTHPYWAEILQRVTVDDDPSALALFDLTEVVADKFQRLSERVTAHSGRVFFDGDEVDNSLTRKVVEFLNQKVDDWKPLVAFMEKVFTNPEVHSREQLFDFLAHNEFSITSEGDIVGYKGLYSDGYGYGDDKPEGWESHSYRSAHRGTDTVTVDGVANTGYVWQSVGSVVEMARSAVMHDPSTGCSHGLHIANFEYARGYGDVTARVSVNPRDVVSVPTEHQWQKVRACRYVFEELVTEPYVSALLVTEPENEPEPETAPEEAVAFDLKAETIENGDTVVLNEDKWICGGRPLYGELAGYGGVVGNTYTVVEADSTAGGMNGNSRVKRDDRRDFYVATDAISLVSKGNGEVPPSDDESWDSWDDEDYSWSW